MAILWPENHWLFRVHGWISYERTTGWAFLVRPPNLALSIKKSILFIPHVSVKVFEGRVGVVKEFAWRKRDLRVIVLVRFKSASFAIFIQVRA